VGRAILNGAGIFILFIKCNTYGRKLSSQWHGNMLAAD
jgi:hypothetical protein